MFRVVVAGSRSCTDQGLVNKSLDKILANKLPEVIIVSGTCRGADLCGEKYGKLKQLTIERYPAEWDKYGKRAGYIRNETMAKVADGVVVFWDGRSNGSKHMIKLTKKYNKLLRVVLF